MGVPVDVMRSWVFPVLRLILVAVVAVALVKLAFFPDSAGATDPARPTGEIVEPQVPVTVGTITNEVTLPGTVNADPALPVRATAQGTVDEVFAEAPQKVVAGEVLYDIRVETLPDPVEGTDADGNPTVSQPRPVVTFQKVLAPADGVLSSLTVIHGQAVAVGDTTGQVAPPGFSVSGSLSPEQQYRLLAQPTEASVAIRNGPAPFTCTGLTITTALNGAGSATADEPGDGGSGGGTGTSVRCAVPPEVRVFAGLAADITIAGGRAENVLTVPTTAVQGSAETGVVWFVLPDGSTEERPVTLGMNDGVNVEVVDGLAEGDLVNQFVPGAVEEAPDGCTTFPDGSVECLDVGIVK